MRTCSLRQAALSAPFTCTAFRRRRSLNIAEVSGLTLRDTIAPAADAGLDSIPGGGAEILDDEVRLRIAGLKCTTDEWLPMHRTAHELGMRTTATMMFGCGERLEHRVHHFERIRQLAGRDRRIHRLHPLVFPARRHFAGTIHQGGSHGGGLSEDAGDFAASISTISTTCRPSGSRRAFKICQIGVALRRQRRGQHPDRGERGVHRRMHQQDQRRRVAANYPRRRLPSREARHVVSGFFPPVNQ